MYRSDGKDYWLSRKVYPMNGEVYQMSPKVHRIPRVYPNDQGVYGVDGMSRWPSHRAIFFSPVALTVQTFHGVQFDGILSMGLTAGIDEYFGLRVVPIAVGSRGVLPGKKVSPYFGVEVGYGFTWFEKQTYTLNRMAVRFGMIF